MTTYGFAITTDQGHRGCLTSPEISPNGQNIILRAGREIGLKHEGWHAKAHIVLTPEEAQQLAQELAKLSE